MYIFSKVICTYVNATNLTGIGTQLSMTPPCIYTMLHSVFSKSIPHSPTSGRFRKHQSRLKNVSVKHGIVKIRTPV